ncbi:MAG: peroxidase-related enzyme [Gammaproteobacteria bacterium]|nr:peroxidase-related enzyme [Gammaproteobacteria bacterium]MDH3372967.1 peroxidase-related enzyme [Gammaproteobacteria bacterium]MDH3408959.1 peroxidase-related enzyme [Gammaproteobacteria bacterium]
MTWISTISYDEASGALRRLYDRIKGPDNNVDNIMLAHSLRPHTMQGHMTLYKSVLHHPRNTLSKSYLETIGVYVSLLNQCQYCVEHHFAGLMRLLADDERAAAIRRAFEDRDPAAAFSGRELAGLEYAERLTTRAAEMSAEDIAGLRRAGFEDGEILELNQVAAYFAYANRTVLGIGVDTDGDIIGLSPGDSSNPDNWSHQ